jgi:hypothetical protein
MKQVAAALQKECVLELAVAGVRDRLVEIILRE